MEIALLAVVLAAAVTALNSLAGRFAISAPLLLVAVGIAASFVPGLPEIELLPEVVLLGLLPPLLYSAATRTSLVDFRRNRRPIGLLSVGLVVFTTIGIGLLTTLLLPEVPLAAALALGAVVAPPDAVAAMTIARRVGMPRRVVTILKGESLVNDATALVCLRLAIVAISGTVSVGEIAVEFALSAGGGLLVGLAVGWLVATLRSRVTDPVTDGVVSLLTPWLAYLPAEEVHASGVLAVVVAGLLLGHRSPTIQHAASRIFERTIWSAVQFLLEGLVFLLIGLQLRRLLVDLEASDIGITRTLLVGAALIAAVLVLRIVWVFPATYVPRLIPSIRRVDRNPPWQVPMLVSWAAMRGVVTLAAVFLLPADTPERSVLVLIAFVVTVGTLLLNGTTLPYMVRWLGLSGPDPAEDHLQEAGVLQRASTAATRALDEALVGDEPEAVVARLRRRSVQRAEAAWERLGNTPDPPSAVYARPRERMLEAERAEIVRIRDEGVVAHDVLRDVLLIVDLEENMIEHVQSDASHERGSDLMTPEQVAAVACDHLSELTVIPPAQTPDGCAECLRAGTDWVHLRLCVSCGQVACCDSSTERHAEAHFRQTGHPVIRSFETGEGWRWCFIDERLA
ncbi:MAG: Na+/H+ antiporter [Actinomycetota bacterium]|nr:Na+/H+ antiporter [Actinomycetota bacterium]